MNLKLHLVIVTAIVAALYFVWQAYVLKPAEVTSVVVSGYSIQISRASYGMACQELMAQAQDAQGNENPFKDDSNEKKILENNVLDRVATLCNGKAKCRFKLSKDTMGVDPFPNCGMKDLRVEFRCFGVDRLRRLTFRENKQSNATINCDKLVGN